MAWVDDHAGALSAVAALGTLAFTVVLVFVTRTQAKIAKRQTEISAEQVALQAEIHQKEGPVLRLYFNGLQSQPGDTRNEMLWLMVSVGNEGRQDIRVTHLDIHVLKPKTEGYHAFALYPQRDVGHGTNARGQYEPVLPKGFTASLMDADTEKEWQAGGVIKSHDGESFYVAIPAGMGYEKWKRVRLRVSGIGVKPATKDIDWDLWWLNR